MKVLAEFKRSLNNHSLTSEIFTTDGEAWVLKIKASHLGIPGLVREFVVNRIAQALGWEIPAVEPILITQSTTGMKGPQDLNEALQRSFGINLGIQLISEAEPLPEKEIKKLSIRFLQRMAALDVYFCNDDRKVESQNILRQKNGKVWMIDHARCLFLDPEFSQRPFFIPPGHILEKERIQFLTPDHLREISKMEWAEKAISELPRQWLEEMQTTPEQLIQILALRSSRLANELN